MKTAKTLTLWSLRHSAARGNHFIAERTCTEATVQDWLSVFRKDEPGVTFVASSRRPPIK